MHFICTSLWDTDITFEMAATGGKIHKCFPYENFINET